MREIPLTQGQVALVDDADYEWLNQWKWCSCKCVNRFSAVRQATGRKIIKMHHQIIGKKDGLEVDHVNGNGLDNRRCNLRHVTSRQNSQNLHTEKSSIYPGVCWDKEKRKWRGCFRYKGKQKHLGYFKTEADAFAAYCAALESIGERVLVNA